MSEAIELHPFELTQDQLARLGFNYKLGRALRITALRLGLLALVTIGIDLTFNLGWIAAAVGVGFIVVVFAFAIVQRWRIVTHTAKDPMNRLSFSRRLVSFDDQEIRTTYGDNVRLQVPFVNFVKADLAEDIYMLWLSSAQIHMIPRLAFKSPADEQTFRQILSARGLLSA